MNKATAAICKIVREYDLGYDELKYTMRKVREELNLKSPARRKTQPDLLTDDELFRFFSEVSKSGDINKILIFDLLYYSGLRLSEAINIQVSNIDVDNMKIKIVNGKGGKDRYVIYPINIQYRMIDKVNSQKHPGFLFRNKTTNNPYTGRTVQNWAKSFAEKAKIEKNIHPHLLRHQFGTKMKQAGMPDEWVASLMGHENVQSTKTYTHLAPEMFRDSYNDIFNTK